MSSLAEYYKSLNIYIFEGHSQECKPETEFLHLCTFKTPI